MTWQPRRVVLASAFATVAVLLAVATLAGAQARLLAGAGAMLVGLEAARVMARRPALSVDGGGLRVATGWRHTFVPWSSVVSVSAVRTGRLVPTTALEIDTDVSVLVLSAYQLGEDAAAVAAEVNALRPGD